MRRIETFMVTEYRIFNISSAPVYKSIIILTGADGWLCWVDFLDDDEDLPPAQKIGDKRFHLFYHFKQLEQCIDMLRNEKPIYASFHSESSWHCRISTAPEPVGEGEENLITQRMQEISKATKSRQRRIEAREQTLASKAGRALCCVTGGCFGGDFHA